MPWQPVCDGHKRLVGCKSELLCQQPVWMLRTSLASLVNKHWVGLETICCLAVSSPFKFSSYLCCHLLLFLCLLFQMPWHSLNISVSMTFISTSTLFFLPCTYSPSFITHCSTVTYAWSMSDEVRVFLNPLLCFSLHKRSKFEQLLCGLQPARKVVMSGLLSNSGKSFCTSW